jgi:nucleoside-diphosphate-sugar epimerase
MRIAVAGAHGQVARRLGRLLAARGDTVVGIVRNPAHTDDLRGDGVQPVVLDLEGASVDEVADAVRDCDAVVFAAGAGPGSGAARKDTVDRDAALLLADAAERAGVLRYVLVSSMGVEQARHGTPAGMDPVFAVYLQAKLAAEDRILPRRGLETTIVRPGRLTDEPGTGRITLGHGIERGDVPRDDVAALLAAVLDAEAVDDVVEVVSGSTPIAEAVAALP